MRKILITILSLLLFLGGCGTISSSKADNDANPYASFYKAISDNEKFLNTSPYYTISGEMSELPDGTFRYYIFLDSPIIAMYDVKMMTVENDTPYEEATKMFPSIGILDGGTYTLIPNQVKSDSGFVKGLMISGEIASQPVDVKLVVEYCDKTRANITRDFYSMTISMEGVQFVDTTTTSVGGNEQ